MPFSDGLALRSNFTIVRGSDVRSQDYSILSAIRSMPEFCLLLKLLLQRIRRRYSAWSASYFIAGMSRPRSC